MRFHGVDRHKRYWTISQRDENCQEVGYVARHCDVEGYVQSLGPEDVVALEASTGSFYWADRIEARGARCVVVDPYRFRIIRDSWNKTDRRDAVNLSLGLWMAHSSGECRLPEVYKPSVTVRQLRQLKNQIQAVLTEEGLQLDRQQAQRLVDNPAQGSGILEALELSAVSRVCVQISLKLLGGLLEQKEHLREQIMQAGRPLEAQVKLLMGIRGIAPLLALAFPLRGPSAGRHRGHPPVYELTAAAGLPGGGAQSPLQRRHHAGRASEPLQPLAGPHSVHPGHSPPGGLLAAVAPVVRRRGGPQGGRASSYWGAAQDVRHDASDAHRWEPVPLAGAGAVPEEAQGISTSPGG
jgi:hypothetical protein